VALEQFNLDGQVAIVTGAGRGVGEGIAKVLAEAGATVVRTARTTSEVEHSHQFDFIVDGGLQGQNSSLPIPDL
jgi:7-alpha-hydroxysteroid dehydrogenase